MRSLNLPTSRSQRAPRPDRSATWAFWGLVGPLVMGLIVFTIVPLVWGFALSFQNARGTIEFDVSRWVGLDNFRRTLADPAFRESLITGALYAALVVPLTLVFGLALALLVNSVRRGQAFFRTALFMPTAVSFVVGALIWKIGLFNGLSFGIANTVLGLFGWDPIVWTLTSPWVWVVLVSLRLWLTLGFNMLIFLAGLKEVPAQLYEAARIDGASSWQSFWGITFPLLRNTSIFLLFVNVIGALQAFDEFYNVLGSGVSSLSSSLAGRPPIWYIYDTGFATADYGRGSASAFLLAGIILLATLLQVRLFGLGQRQND
ncbi:sugar ABC transporter permease [Deinococcus sp. Arct2-2]|uniref:carbohydrate ABC transporter permease n=1 Tax=Deinococcus sp. Arct2-2 TaxID=2568653 RepID=UPI0010A58A74|nr:sugar ABC transporter permease [Deinococcus sp. Arct2-2]THF66742.1 sugar ABC transporter permease [Deinococcus sp. Arct2-2]